MHSPSPHLLAGLGSARSDGPGASAGVCEEIPETVAKAIADIAAKVASKDHVTEENCPHAEPTATVDEDHTKIKGIPPTSSTAPVDSGFGRAGASVGTAATP